MILENLARIDRALLLFVNGLQGNTLIDHFFLYATFVGTAWLALPLAAVAFVHRNGLQNLKQKHFWMFGALVGVVVVALTVTLKFTIARDRPPRALPELVHVVGPRLEAFSFPSGHTVTVFAVLGFFWAIDRRLAWAWLPLACLVAFSRIYLGVHYPSDVIGAALLGFVPAWLIGRMEARI